jgi:hypothetical protein
MSAPYLGDFNPGQTVHFCWDTNNGAGASVTPSGTGTVSVYKNLGTTQSVAGVTDTRTFDALTGIQACAIDLSADGTFYSAGADFEVVLSASTIDGQTVNAVLAHFSIENRNIKANVTQYGGTNGTFAGGRPEVNMTHIAGSAVSTSTAQLGVNTVNAGGTAWGSGAITAASIATGAFTAAKFAANALDAVWSTATRLLTAGTNIVLAKGTGVTGFNDLDASGVRGAVGLASANLDTQLAAVVAAIAALNNVSTAQVKAQMVAALTTDTYAEPAAVPAATASLKDKIGWVATLSRNKLTQTATTQTLRNDADSGSIATSTDSDDLTTAVRGKWS